jgi:hypothetical protein
MPGEGWSGTWTIPKVFDFELFPCPQTRAILSAEWQNRFGQKASSGLGERASPLAVGGRAPSVRSRFQAERHAAKAPALCGDRLEDRFA